MDAQMRDAGRDPIDGNMPRFSRPVYFSPTDYFLGVAQRLAASLASARIILPGKGEVVMLANRRGYCAHAVDLKEFCRAPAGDFEVVRIKEEPAAESGPPGRLQDLLWVAAFHASQGRLVQSRSNGEAVHLHDVIRFRHWPNLTRVPQTPNTMRICALLTREPSSIMLVARKLGIEPEEVYQVYSAACSSGIVNVISNHMGQANVQASAGGTGEGSGMRHEHGLLHALFSKIAGL